MHITYQDALHSDSIMAPMTTHIMFTIHSLKERAMSYIREVSACTIIYVVLLPSTTGLNCVFVSKKDGCGKWFISDFAWDRTSGFMLVCNQSSLPSRDVFTFAVVYHRAVCLGNVIILSLPSRARQRLKPEIVLPWNLFESHSMVVLAYSSRALGIGSRVTLQYINTYNYGRRVGKL